MPEAFKYVKLPDGKYAKFRADASPEQMKTQVQKDFPQAFTPDLGATQPEFLPRAAAYSGVNKGLQKGAEYLGADPETSEFIGNVGTMAAPFMENVPFKAAAAKVGNAAANIVDPDIVGLVSPRAA